MKETFKTNLLIPQLNILFEAQFKKSQKSNDLQNILLIHLLYGIEKYENYTITDFLIDITGIKKEKLLDFVLIKFVELINNKVILFSKPNQLTVEEVKKMYISQLGVNNGTDRRIIHPTIKKEFDNDNFIGLESKTIERNYIYIKNLINLEENIVKNKTIDLNNKNNENFIYIDNYGIYKNTYDIELRSSLKTKFEDITYNENEIFVDYILNKKEKNEFVNKDDIFWTEGTFIFSIDENIITTNEATTRKYLKKVSGLNVDEDDKPIIEIKDFIKQLLNTEKVESIKNDFELKNNNKNYFSFNLNSQITQKKWSDEEKDLESLFGKKMLVNSDKNIFYIYLNKFEISFYDLKDNVIGFVKEEVDIDQLFSSSKNIKLENRKYSSFAVNLLMENMSKIIDIPNFNDWFITNLSQINKIDYTQAKDMINKIPLIKSTDILEILSKTNEFKTKEFNAISVDLFDLLVDNGFNEWNKLNDKINFKYDGNNYLFAKKWNKEEEIDKFYEKLKEITRYKNSLENKQFDEQEYNENIEILENNYEKFYENLAIEINPIKTIQIIGYVIFEKNIKDIKKILNGSIFNHKIYLLRDIRVKLERELGLDGKIFQRLSDALSQYENSDELKYIKKITNELLHPASHNTETKEFKNKINNLTLDEIRDIENNVIEASRNLKIVIKKQETKSGGRN
ncbi:hypothetical protein KQ876_01610 [Mycoplasma sp. CSL7491-lung]|uniref:hypothetical protein n=1 Tax=Mycoplasma sp. CSL7491-lung TaxID=549718 RepID=UPI001C1267F9|nr:hypothetical protein [Mycoplasma sp. CSL7491-lung]MBU4692903.1 hypothetical protein [Mycoplasma sp. CSL7491-lung]